MLFVRCSVSSECWAALTVVAFLYRFLFTYVCFSFFPQTTITCVLCASYVHLICDNGSTYTHSPELVFKKNHPCFWFEAFREPDVKLSSYLQQNDDSLLHVDDDVRECEAQKQQNLFAGVPFLLHNPLYRIKLHRNSVLWCDCHSFCRMCSSCCWLLAFFCMEHFYVTEIMKNSCNGRNLSHPCPKICRTQASFSVGCFSSVQSLSKHTAYS